MSSPRNLHQLLLVKQLYEDACLLSEREDTFSHTKAVILLDLSVEVMLNSLVLNLDPDLTVNAAKGSQDTDRKTLWGNAATALNKAKSKRLSEFREMAGLHALRNLVQHNGTEPTQTEVKRYLPAAEQMLSSAFRDAYGLEFTNFRIWDLIPNEGLRQLLLDSEYALTRDHPAICIVGCNLAHRRIIAAIRNFTKLRRFRVSSVFSRDSSQRPTYPVGFPLEAKSQLERAARQIHNEFRRGVAQFRKEIMEEMEFLEDEVVTIGVGMPLMDTRRFQKIGSEVLHFIAESGDIQIREKWSKDKGQDERVKEAVFTLNYLSRLVRLVEDAYPGILNDIEIAMPLSAQKWWGKVDQTTSLHSQIPEQA